MAQCVQAHRFHLARPFTTPLITISRRNMSGHHTQGKLSGKTAFITGSSRGIGLAIAKELARNGANIVIAAKTAEPHPKLPGTVFTAAEEVKEAGKDHNITALPLILDVRDDTQIASAIAQVEQKLGAIDILINNASAISLTSTADTPMRRYDLMMSINVRGTLAMTQACLPLLRRASNPHVLVLSPPIPLEAGWFKACGTPYTLSKYGMSLCVQGMAEEFADIGVAVNALWPATLVNTSALRLVSAAPPETTREPELMGDAAAAIVVRQARECTGQFFIAEEVMCQEGLTMVEINARYNSDPKGSSDTVERDLFLGKPTKQYAAPVV